MKLSNNDNNDKNNEEQAIKEGQKRRKLEQFWHPSADTMCSRSEGFTYHSGSMFASYMTDVQSNADFESCNYWWSGDLRTTHLLLQNFKKSYISFTFQSKGQPRVYYNTSWAWVCSSHSWPHNSPVTQSLVFHSFSYLPSITVQSIHRTCSKSVTACILCSMSEVFRDLAPSWWAKPSSRPVYPPWLPTHVSLNSCLGHQAGCLSGTGLEFQ